jgi:hypothetical protein
MAKMIQIRNVPEAVHRTLKTRAAQTRMTLSDYLRAEIEELAGLPTVAELTERIRQRSRVKTKVSSAAVIRQHRGE